MTKKNAFKFLTATDHTSFLFAVLFIFCNLTFFVPQAALARRAIVKIKVQTDLRVELNGVLKSASTLQEASFKRNEGATSVAVKDLLKNLNRAMKKAHLAKEQETHLVKILTSAKENLERSRRSSGSDRQTYYQKAFKQLVLIAQVYQLDPYKIFFCPKDKSVWLQKSSKPQNPINPETYGSCGKQAT